MIIALGIFVFILIVSASVWDNSRQRIYLAEQRNDLELIARNAMSSLILTPGEPVEWQNLATGDFNEINVKSIGLINGSAYRLNKDKIKYLTDPNVYGAAKRILGVMGPGYEFFLEIKAYDGTQFTENSQGGIAPDMATDVVVVERGAAYGSKWAVVRLRVWKHE